MQKENSETRGESVPPAVEELPPQLASLVNRLVSAIEGVENAIQGEKEAATKAERSARVEQNVPPLVRAEAYLPKGVEVHKSQADASEDKNYQFWALFVAWSTLGAIAIYAFVSAWQLFEMRKATKATQDAAQAAQSASETAAASIRPWIKISNVELRPGIGPIRTLSFHWPDTGAIILPNLQIRITALNVGHSPAKDVQVIPELFFSKFDGGTWQRVITDEENRYCKSVINSTPDPTATIVFPSDPTETFMGISGVIRDADIFRATGNSSKYSSAAVILCVNYRGTEELPYQTQAWFGLYEDHHILLPLDVDADADRLSLIREPDGDQAN